MDKSTKIILGIGLLGATGAALWYFNRKRKDADIVTPDPVQTPAPVYNYVVSPGPFPAPAPAPKVATFTDKVKELQRLLGVTADGVIGPQTMAAAAKFGITTINAQVIDGVIQVLKLRLPGMRGLSGTNLI